MRATNKITKDTRQNGSGWQVRDFKGWWQAREFSDGKPSRWQFEVPWFSSDDAHCSVLRADGTLQEVRIDAANRIYIDGRWYDSRHWHH